ncbi:hypothetical protein GH714_015577 [Hevea brasiliensis]|uniref:WAT1-related protein n=1 Tax=Hevea brasiliensis TaxID=3981 RepID=A0A6A6KPB4_HEVBR|nr:hypothetical protein GH714_015577 [Hevea brasiliensis]
MCAVPERTKLQIAMTIFQFGYAGNHVILRAALNMGISKLVFPVYRNITALLLLAPVAYFLEKKDRPALTTFLMQFFILGFVGIASNQGFYLLGLDNTSPTFASATENAVPAIREVHLSRKDGIAKLDSITSNLLEEIPAPFSVYSFTCFFGTLQLLAVAALLREILRHGRFTLVVNSSAFFIRAYLWGLQGLVVSGIGFAIQIWVIQRGGPVFVSGYLPVQTMLVALMASVVLGENSTWEGEYHDDPTDQFCHPF